MKMSFIFSGKTKGWKSENPNKNKNKNKNKNNNKNNNNNNNNNNNKAIPRTALLAVKNRKHLRLTSFKSKKNEIYSRSRRMNEGIGKESGNQEEG